MSVLLTQSGGTSNFFNITNLVYKGQAYRANTGGTSWGTIDYILANIGRSGNPGNAVLKVYATTYATIADVPIGAVTVGAEVGSVSLATSGWNNNDLQLRTFTFTSPISVSDVVYLVTIQCPTADATNYIKMYYGSGTAAGALQSTDSGVTWTNAVGNGRTIQVWGTYATPSKATTPTPANAASDVTLDQETLTWVDGGGATSYDVYYGTTSGSLTKVSSSQAGLSYTITGITSGSPFNYLVTRYWRIDSINSVGTTTGDEWSFTTIRLNPPTVTYFYPTTGQYYYLLVQSDGTYGDPPGVGVENTDYVYLAVGYSPNFMKTIRKLVSAANSKIWYEDV